MSRHHQGLLPVLLVLLSSFLGPALAAEELLSSHPPRATVAGVPTSSTSITPLSQTAWNSGDPTSAEQYVLEIVNRARKDPVAEGVRLGIDITEGLTTTQKAQVGPRAPLAMNAILLSTARAHSQDMWTNNYFAHNSPSGATPFDRMTAAGYIWNTPGGSAGENIAAATVMTAAQLEDLLMIDAGIADRGHRTNLLDIGISYREVGVGSYHATAVDGMNMADFLTQDFGTSATGPFVLGVVYDDANGNGFYDIGEGLSGITVTPSSGAYYAVTGQAGGYAFPVATSGSLTLTFSGGSLPVPIIKTVTLGSSNIKVDATKSAVPPTITALIPTNGSTNGGNSITITGTSLTGVTGVTFGGTTATGITANTDTSVTVTSPAHAAGTVDVVLTATTGTATSTGAFTYAVPGALTITGISPNHGSTSGGATVTISGTNLTGVSSITFGGTAGTGITANTATSVTVTSPVHAAGTVDVVLTATAGTVTSTGAFSFIAPPNITSFNPASGTTSGGTSVTITGANLNGVTAITFAGVAGTGISGNTATSVTVTTPAHAAGAAPVTLTTAAGTVTATTAFTYTAAAAGSGASSSDGGGGGGGCGAGSGLAAVFAACFLVLGLRRRSRS